MWHQNITKHSHLTAHISTMLEDADTCTHSLTKALNIFSGSEGHGSSRISGGCRHGQHKGLGGGGGLAGEKKSVSRIDGEKGGGRKWKGASARLYERLKRRVTGM